MGARVRAVLADRALGPLALSLLAHGVSQGMVGPFVALWIAAAYHLGALGIAAYFAASAMGGLAINPLLGRLSDRTGRRRPTVMVATVMQSAGLAVLATRPPFAIVLVVAGLLICAQLQPPLFAMVNDRVGAGDERFPRATTIAIERAMISAAWAVGAPLGGLLLPRSYALLFGVSVAFNLTAGVLAWLRCPESTATPIAAGHGDAGAGPNDPGAGGTPGTPSSSSTRWRQLLLLGASMVLITGGNASKMQAVPLYLRHLGLPTTLVGATFSWMAIGELFFMLPAGRLADHLSRKWVVALGACGGAIFFAAAALVPSALAVVAAFPAISFMVGAVYGVGIGYAQDLDPARPGLAGGIFFAAQGVGVTAGGALISGAEAVAGVPVAFLGPALAILCGGALVLTTRPQREVAARTAPARALPAGAGAGR